MTSISASHFFNDTVIISREHVKASIRGAYINLLLIERYKRLIEDTYTEPQNEEILGCYLNQQEVEEHPELRQKTKKKVLERKKVATKDIGIFLPLFLLCHQTKETTQIKLLSKLIKKEKKKVYYIIYYIIYSNWLVC